MAANNNTVVVNRASLADPWEASGDQVGPGARLPTPLQPWLASPPLSGFCLTPSPDSLPAFLQPRFTPCWFEGQLKSRGQWSAVHSLSPSRLPVLEFNLALVVVGGDIEASARCRTHPNCVPLRVLGLWLGSCFHIPGPAGPAGEGVGGLVAVAISAMKRCRLELRSFPNCS